MGYKFTIDKSAGTEVLICPNEGDNLGIEAADIAEMIETMFYDRTMGERFTEDDLLSALNMYNNKNRIGQVKCYHCGKLFNPDPVKLMAWAESGQSFDPTDWECEACKSILSKADKKWIDHKPIE